MIGAGLGAVVLALVAALPKGIGGDDARWRIKFVDSQRYIMVAPKDSPEDGWQTITTSEHFFTPFLIIRDPERPSRYEFRDHVSGGVIRVFGSPGVPGETMAARRLFITHGRRRRPRLLHGTANATLPLPAPPLVGQSFHLASEVGGEYVSLRPMEETRGHARLDAPHEKVCEEVRKNWTSGESVLALVVQRVRVSCSHLVQLERIASAEPEPEGTPDRQARARARKAVRSAIRRVTFDVGGRETVLVTAFNLDDIDWIPLSLRWLAVNGHRKLLVLHTDAFTCSGVRSLNVPEVEIECLSAAQLSLPVDEVWRSEVTPDWGLSAHPAETTYLQRGKVKLMEVALKDQVDVIFVDPDVLVLSPEFARDLASHPADIAFGSDRRTIRNRDFLVHPENCPASLPGYRPYVEDWVDTGVMHLRAGSKAALAFVREVQVLMDAFVLSDADAAQAILTGHAQLSDPLRSPRLGGRMRANDTWTKPLWLQTSDFVSGRIQRRGLAGQPGIKPLNAPLTPARWSVYQQMVRTKGLKWHVFPQEVHGNGPIMVENWAPVFARGLGSTRFDGTRSGKLLSIHVNCATKAFLEGGPGSFLFRPEPFADTVALATHDFPES